MAKYKCIQIIQFPLIYFGKLHFTPPKVSTHLCFNVQCSKIDNRPPHPNLSHIGKNYHPSMLSITLDGFFYQNFQKCPGGGGGKSVKTKDVI